MMLDVRHWASGMHKSVMHFYGVFDYEVHLDAVADAAWKFRHLIPEEDYKDVESACYCHDLIEDARLTYNDVLRNTNLRIAEITYALTNEKGKNRAERASDKYYSEMRLIPYAVFVKCCDRIANMEYAKKSSRDGQGMYPKYKAELPGFKDKLYCEELKEMFEYMETI